MKTKIRLFKTLLLLIFISLKSKLFKKTYITKKIIKTIQQLKLILLNLKKKQK